MRILQVIPTIDPEWGGPAHAISGMAVALAKRGHLITIAHAADGTNVVLPAEGVGCPGVEIRGFRRSFPRRFAASHDMMKWLRASVGFFDIVHVHSIFAICSLMAGRVCRASGVPYIARPHGSLDPYDLRKKAVLKKLIGPVIIRKHLEDAAMIHCTSTREAARLQVYGASVHKVVAPLPIPHVVRRAQTATGPSFREALGVAADDFLILFMSRLHPKKNLELVLEAVRQVSHSFPHVHLAVAGSGQPRYVSQIRAIAHHLVERGVVTFCGFLNGATKTNALMESDVFVLPSQNENFGVAVVEALQTGTPVIVSQEVYIADEIEQAGAGLVCGLDASDLAGKLVTLIQDKCSGGRLLQQLRAGALEIGITKFGEDVCVERLLEIYEEVRD